MKQISSADNPTFRLLRQLAESGRERRKRRRTLLDGPHLVQAYLERIGAPEMLVASRSGLDRPEIRRLAERAAAGSTLVLTDELFEAVAPVDTPSGVLALVPIPPEPAAVPARGSCVVLESVQDAGNVGSILRSAAAAGVPLALLTRGCAQAWSPKVLRAAMGAHFSLGILEHADPAALLAAYPGAVVATRADAPLRIFEADLRGPVAWLFGNEGAGLSPEVAALARLAVAIPMPGGAESLNVAAAAAICLYEQLRQRQVVDRS